MRNFKIKSYACVSATVAIDSLDEKRIVPKMMLRRRLTRAAKIVAYLGDKCSFTQGLIVYGSAYGELPSTADILRSIRESKPISPTSFQNSVYNTAPSYFSLLHNNTDEIITISSAQNSSLDALKTAALQAIYHQKEVFVVCTETLNIDGIDEVNSCKTALEQGVACIIEPTDQKADIELSTEEIDSTSSLSHMLGIITSCKDRESAIVSLPL